MTKAEKLNQQNKEKRLLCVGGMVPPQAEDIEKAILGIILMENQSYYRAVTILNPDSFYFQQHEKIWQCIIHLVDKSQPIDALSILNELRKTGNETGIQKEFLFQLMENIANSTNLEAYCRQIEDKAIARRLIKIYTEAVQAAYMGEENIHDVLSKADVAMIDATKSLTAHKNPTSEFIGNKVREQIDRAMQTGGIVGVPTGVDSIDRILGGFRPGNIYTIAARTRVGKSALAAAFAYNAASQFGAPSIIFSMEMSDVQLWIRLLSIRLRELKHSIPYADIDKGRLTKEQRKIVEQAIIDVQGIPIYIDDTPNLTSRIFRAKLVKYKKDYDIKAAYLDYIQIAKMMEGGTRADSITEFMVDLKTTAKELDIPIIPLSQIDRQVEKGGGMRVPTIADLKGSGGLEEGSDAILIMSRAEATEEDPVDEMGMSQKGIIDIHIAKHKMGETGIVREQFDVSTNFFGATVANEIEIDPIEAPAAADMTFYKNNNNFHRGNSSVDEDAPF